MSQSPEPATASNIYDLGYRNYTGARLGRRNSVAALYTASLRACFGLGRRSSAKIIPVALAIVAAIPAVIQLGVAAAFDDVEVFRLASYYEYVQVVLALFVAAQAPELLGRDMRNRTLPLYFSRPLKRRDYAWAKLGALATAMLFLTLVPVTVMFIGNGFANDDTTGYFKDNIDQVFPIIASAVVLSIFVSAVALAIASQTPRRAYATGGIIAAFVLSSTIASILFATIGHDGRWALLLGLDQLMQGATYWIFNATPSDELADADVPGALYFLVLAAITAACTWYLIRRYQRMSA